MYLYATTADALPQPKDPSEVAAWLRVASSDPVLLPLYEAAMLWAEGYCNQPLFLRTYTVRLNNFSASGRLRGLNIDTPTVAYDTDVLTAEPLDLTGYVYAHEVFSFVPDYVSTITPKRVTVTYTAGYTEEKIPRNIQLALWLYAGYLYDNRANPVAERFTAAEALLQPYKLYSV